MTEDTSKIIEQIQSEQDYFQKARLLHYLIKQKDVPLKTVSESIGLKPSYLCHILRLNKIPEIIVDGYYSKLISLSHLFVLSRLKSDKQMFELYEKVLAGSLTVLQTEQEVREILYSTNGGGERIRQREIESLIEDIASDVNSVVVKLTQTRVRARLMIEVKGGLKKTSEMLRPLLERLHKKESG